MSKLSDWLAGASDPVKLAKSLQFQPDPWQRKVLRSNANYLHLVCSRQVGKSTVTALAALHTALYKPGSTILLLSPTDRQSGELYLKISGFYRALGKPIEPTQENVHTLRLENDSRILSLPASESGVRGFTAKLILIDEAGYVPDALFKTLSPMLAVSGGKMFVMGTPAGQRGFFWETSLADGWEHIVVPATDCPRISQAFLDAERERLGDTAFESEYLCSFRDSAGSAFRAGDIGRMFEYRDRAVEPAAPAPPTDPNRRRERELMAADRQIQRVIGTRARHGPRAAGPTPPCSHGDVSGRCPRCANGWM